ncbi:MAG: biotin/lipoyl-binding protein [Thermanaeromonas sp.]|uniref:biotin/lipoyl-containing protein n=1 Tax=Thermanaeromonas sp. TaxID=2003697 RepID=UPI0024377305|nr:biotin/lipoyl-containing protein [Thermanaeromonas sp.]MCG0277790.1 biotin/lipoyl-binding protein [Thermanaeromonas sp.]
MRRFRVTVNGETFEVEVEEIKGGAVKQTSTPSPVVELPNRVPNVTPSAPPAAPTAGSASAGGNVTAPMPGNILSIKVKEGEEVKAGQVLLILEAMKMQNEIVAPRNGKVKKIYVSAGQSVNTGDPLISIE